MHDLLDISGFKPKTLQIHLCMAVRVFALTLFCFFIFFTSAMATSYVVDKGNTQCSDDGDGTSQQPFCTINTAAMKVVAGDNVTVKAGTYPEYIVLQQSGTSGAPITFAAAAGETVVISDQTNGFKLPGVSWITIDGFNVDNTSSTAVLLDSSANIVLRNNSISNADNHGIEIKACNDITIDTNDIADSLGYGIYARDSFNITLSNSHVSGSGLPFQGLVRKGVYFNNTVDSIISGNISESNTNTGIYLSNGSSNNQIINNTTYNNARVYVRAAPGIELRSSPNNIIEANISYINEDTGIQIYPGASNNLVVNNVSYNNGDHGIDVLNAPNNRIISNTVFNNLTSGINIEGSSTDTTIANNISVDNALNSPRTRGNIRVDNDAMQGTTLNYDLLFLSESGTMVTWGTTGYSSLSDFQTATTQETQGIEADPAWIDPGSANFRLNSSSPAIDSADASASGVLDRDQEMLPRVDDPDTTDTGKGPPVTYYDRGAYEFQAGNNAAPIVSITEPSDGATVSGQISIFAEASDLDGTIAGVQFKLDDNNLGNEDTSEPYSIVWDTNTVNDGQYTITALASDDENATTLSSPINISVANNIIQLSVIASDDAYIKQAKPNQNRGSSTKLWVDSSPNIYETLLKFYVTGIDNKQVTDAKLYCLR